jgi:hypothetical protein
MLITILAKIIFFGLILILALYSVIMLYSLIRFGKSKVLGLVMSALYLLLMVSLYTAAQNGFNAILFPTLSL